jgi:spermidine synthase
MSRMNLPARRVLFVLFFISGFSGLVYQVVWTRLAFASFGIITPVMSVVLSVFMLGLALGSWAGGRWIVPLTERTGWSAACFYGAAELVIGLGAFAVPKFFGLGEGFLLASGQTDSFNYLFRSALVLALSILHWCVCMGATFPFMMAYIRAQENHLATSFSFLYLANVLGAMTGTLLAAVVFIELLGFHHTLWVAAAGNFFISIISFSLGRADQSPRIPAAGAGPPDPVADIATPPEPPAGLSNTGIQWLLFSTGFIAMAMEVVWTRAFTPILKTQVYSFAAIVFVYLGATFAGSWLYRRRLKREKPVSKAILLAALALAAFLPVLVNDAHFQNINFSSPAINPRDALILLGGIVPFCALLGFLTPGLIDEYARGNPARAGRAYAVNVLGCILGPLVACYGLLPSLSERAALIFLALPLLVFCFQLWRDYSRRLRVVLSAALVSLLGWSTLMTGDYETWLKESNPKGATIRRDYAATVISYGEGWDRMLLVNGFGMTILTPITKFMVHLPLAYHQAPPKSALVICFGMGTSYRSAMSWNLDTTVVELVPGVTRAFAYYHADAEKFVNTANGHIVVDDGRRFLKRTPLKFDIIAVDPPPPVQAAGSSLLFSREFFELAKQHLNPGGVIQMWVPGDAEPESAQAVLRSMIGSFPHVRCFPSVIGWGTHLLGSTEPLEHFDAGQLAARMPETARRDLLEWYGTNTAPAVLERVVNAEFPAAAVLNADPDIQVTDDEPFNEYYLLRHLDRKLISH